MKNCLLASLTIAFTVACQSTPEHSESTAASLTTASIQVPMPANIDASQSVSLFNGKDLSGWKVHGTEQWLVEDGLLVGKNGPDNTFGYLYTQAQYQTFILTFEYKQLKQGNSGAFVHATIDDKVTGWQVEIAPPGHSTGGINAYQRGWLVRPAAEKDEVIKMGEWNEMTILVKGGRMTSWLNGTQMATFEDPQLASGKGSIALQIHGENDTHIQWRNINIIAL